MQTAPFPPGEGGRGVIRVVGVRGGQDGRGSGRWAGGQGERDGRCGELLEVGQVGPVTGQPHEDAAGADANLGRHFDQPRPPGAGLAFAEGVSAPTPIVVLAPAMFGQGLGR